ncbi:unnamed protein product [Lota lota]
MNAIRKEIRSFSGGAALNERIEPLLGRRDESKAPPPRHTGEAFRVWSFQEGGSLIEPQAAVQQPLQN